MAELSVTPTAIPGLLVVELPLHADARGWFKENWQRAKMTALGLPDFGPVQHNLSYNSEPGTTRGLHAEPWNKLVSVATGRVFGAWVDLREGPGFGTVVTLELGPDRAVFVPYGVANGFQTFEPGTAYSYLVDDRWSADARERYRYINLADPALGIAWPIPLERAVVSDADRTHPALADVAPVAPRRVYVTGAGGQLGRALLGAIPGARGLTRARLDIADADAVAAFDWSDAAALVNAAGHTAVDRAETPEGRREAWAVNVGGVKNLAEVARTRRIPLVQISSDYVFDGTAESYDEDAPVAPLGVYGQTKAAGDAVAAGVAQHYIVRTSWLVGDGPNFVRTMARLAREGAKPTVVDDQVGRLSFAADVAEGVAHLLRSASPPGIYNVTCDGAPSSWHEIAQAVYAAYGRDPRDVVAVSTAAYGVGRELAPRPARSVLSLDKTRAAGVTPRGQDEALAEYLAKLLAAGD